jgi:hypothetical protein
MHINRGLLFWGVALITAGAVALASSQGVFDPSIIAGSWRLWPVVLIAIGLSIALSRTSFAWLGTLAAALVVGFAGGAVISAAPGFTSCNGEPTSTETSTGTFDGQQATVDLQLTCGTLELSMADGSAWSAQTSVEGNEQPSRDGSPVSLAIRSHDRGAPFERDRQAWTIELGRDVAYDFISSLNAVQAQIDADGASFDGLHITSNAGSTRLRVAGAQVNDLSMQLNAGSAKVIADGETDMAGSMRANAGSIDLCAPGEVGIQITVTSSVAFSHNLEERGFDHEDETFTSPGFAAATHRIVLRVQGNAASFNLNPEEGCA